METLKIDVGRQFLKKIPLVCGCYIFKNAKRQVLYIGKSINLKSRIESYLSENDNIKILKMMGQASYISLIRTDNEIDALILEANLIKKYKPDFNTELKDDKSYPYIKITTCEKVPRVILTRKKISDQNLYFGPYPNSGTLYSLLRFLRHVFPYCTHQKPHKSCLYVHLGLCPCPTDTIKEKNYLKTIKLIINFLEGKKKLMIKLLERNLKLEVEKQNFEEAAKIKMQIDYVNNFKGYKQKLFYNENYKIDTIRNEELESLMQLLKHNNININSLERIEAYDISNISGKNATAAMIVLTNGNPDNKKYRRFKIRTIDKPNDYAMLKETLTRRVNHHEWGIPDLIIIDGGKGQLGSCSPIIKRWNRNVVCIGLSKKLESIILENGAAINLKHDNPALHVLQRARDEAHRFSRKYHRYLRSKSLFF
jgi:excinuclease ABC subunit C